MSFFRRIHKFTSIISIFALLSLSIAPAQAAMVDNDTLVSHTQHDLTVQKIISELDRQEVKDKLISMGVNPENAKTRISQLSDAELAQIQTEFAQMPAGSGIIGAIALVFVVLVVTDMLGATDVFPFVHNINH